MIENDEERRGTNISREVDAGEMMNVVESPQFIVLEDIDLRLSNLESRC